jgi:hypothetical protein
MFIVVNIRLCLKFPFQFGDDHRGSKSTDFTVLMVKAPVATSWLRARLYMGSFHRRQRSFTERSIVVDSTLMLRLERLRSSGQPPPSGDGWILSCTGESQSGHWRSVRSRYLQSL